MIRKIIIPTIVVLLAVSVRAQSVIDEVGEKLVRNFLTDVITMESRFEQSLMDADGIVIESSVGTLEIERPTRFRWSYTEPYEQWLIADGRNVWSYDLDLQQVTVKPQRRALANTPALLLGGSENALEEFDFGGTTITGPTTWVRLVPKDKNGGFSRIELGFIDQQLRRMVFHDNLEQTTLVVLYDVKINEPIDASRFEFIVPDDVDVVGVPALAEVKEP